MDASCRWWSKAALWMVAAASAAGCTEEKPGPMGVTSLRVVVTDPTDFGDEQDRIPDSERTVTVELSVLDHLGQLDATFNGDVQVYSQFLGSLSPDPRGLRAPAMIPITGGTATGTVELPRVFGPTVLWFEDARGDAPTFATGTSPTLWYRDPWIEDVSRPEDLMALTALERSPLESKQVTIRTSKHGADGRLVVTGVYSNAYSLSDANCAARPCTADPFNHILVFTFGRPRDQNGRSIRVGHTVAQVSGGVQEFNGLTELGFPYTVLTPDDTDRSLVPDPVILDPMWLGTQADMINLEAVESALVAVDGATLCPLDQDFDTYGQWKLDVGFGCTGRVFNVISQGTVPEFDPASRVGQVIPRVAGILRAVNIGSFHVWIVEPRERTDIQD